jgi:hypothetical protein
MTAMDVAFEDSETILFEFQDENGRGLTVAMGPQMTICHSKAQGR